MRRLGHLTATMAKYRRQWEEHLPTAAEGISAQSHARLLEVTGFGSNPGNLRMFAYIPKQLAPSPALVVVLHGCTQSAASYDHGAGWSALADKYGFAVLLPEQQPANNAKKCFSWFMPGDTARGSGEALSIRQMVDRTIQDYGIDRGRVFVTGLSAGGAMTSVMLATYPEVFAGGAIIAGLPYGCAGNVQEAFESMFNGRTRPAQEWGDLVRAASTHTGPWPRVSVWHGTADSTVTPINGKEIVKQWADVHGVNQAASTEDRVDGYPRRVWHGPGGEPVIEEYTITGMAHGTPLEPGNLEVPHGAAGPFLLDVGIASSFHIAKFWGLTDVSIRSMDEIEKLNPSADVVPAAQPSDGADSHRPEQTDAAGEVRPSRPGIDIQAVISDALRAAGLIGR